MNATLRRLSLMLLAVCVLGGSALLWGRWGTQIFIAGLGAGLC